MDAAYNNSIKDILHKYRLDYIPEAHNYLKAGDHYLDFTRSNSSYAEFKDKIFTEVEIEFDQISSLKVALHKAFLAQWFLVESAGYSPDEIWEIREKCIEGMQNINCSN